jgi:hypothetical protein
MSRPSGRGQDGTFRAWAASGEYARGMCQPGEWEISHDTTPRVHHAPRRRGSCLAVRRRWAASEDSTNWGLVHSDISGLCQYSRMSMSPQTIISAATMRIGRKGSFKKTTASAVPNRTLVSGKAATIAIGATDDSTHPQQDGRVQEALSVEGGRPNAAGRRLSSRDGRRAHRRIIFFGLPPGCDHDLCTGAISSRILDRDGDY